MFHILSLDPLHHLHSTTLQITLWLSKLTCCSDNTSLSWDLNYTYWSSGNFLVPCADYIKQNKIKCMIFTKTDFITWTMYKYMMAIKKITLVVSWMLVLWSVRTTTMKRSRVDQDLGMVLGLGLETMSTLGAQQRRRQPPPPQPPPLPPPQPQQLWWAPPASCSRCPAAPPAAGGDHPPHPAAAHHWGDHCWAWPHFSCPSGVHTWPKLVHSNRTKMN